MLHKICEKDLLIDCELLAYDLNNIVYNALHGKEICKIKKKTLFYNYFSCLSFQVKKIMFLLFSL